MPVEVEDACRLALIEPVDDAVLVAETVLLLVWLWLGVWLEVCEGDCVAVHEGVGSEPGDDVCD